MLQRLLFKLFITIILFESCVSKSSALEADLHTYYEIDLPEFYVLAKKDSLSLFNDTLFIKGKESNYELCQIWEKGRLIEEFYSNDSLGNDFIKVTPLMDRVKGYNEDILNDYLSSGDTLRNLYTKSLKWFFLYHGMCVTEKQNDTLYYMDFNTQNVVPYSLLTDGNKTLESNRQGWHLTKVNSDSLSVTYYFSDSVVLQTKKQFPIKQGVNSYSFISLESTRKALGKQGFWGEEITAPVYGKRLKSNLTGKRFK